MGGRAVFEHALTAQLSLGYFRALRVSALRRLVLLATPLWVQARTAVFPGWIVWLLVLLVGLTLAEALAYSVLEHAWSRRVDEIPWFSRADVRHAWSGWAEVRSALLYAMAAVTLLPWWGAALGLRLPMELLSPVTRTWMLLLLVLAAAELLPPSRVFRAFVERRSGIES